MKLDYCHIGDCREGMRQLIAAGVRVQCVVTSPPYWGLRDYGIKPSVWGGDLACAHDWGKVLSKHRGGPPGVSDVNEGRDRSQHAATADVVAGQFCSKCGAWLGCLGLEPTYQLYVEHMVEVFDLVRELLADDGTCWINLGDCYATGAGAVGDHPGGGVQGARWKGADLRNRDGRRRPGWHPPANGRGQEQGERVVSGNTRATRDGSHAGKHTAMAAMGPMTQPNRMPQAGLKPKDLCMIPERVVLALQESGWWVRSRIPWLKRNCMPESTKDRPTTATEYVFLLSKSEKYFYDHEAIKLSASLDTHARYARGRSDDHKYADGGPGNQTVTKTFDHMTKPVSGWDKGAGSHTGMTGRYPNDDRRPKAWDNDMGSQRTLITGHKRVKRAAGADTNMKGNESFHEAMRDMPPTRARRNSDWFFESWQGLLTDENGEPLAFVINPRPYKGAHFATFPPALIEPMIVAGTSQHGCCSKCGAQWQRDIERVTNTKARNAAGKNNDAYQRGRVTPRGAEAGDFHDLGTVSTIDRGWRPACDCNADTVPAIVFDPFLGSGTTAEVAQRLGRNWLGCDIAEHYEALQDERTAQMGMAL